MDIISITEIKTLIKILENLEFEDVYNTTHFKEAEVNYGDVEKLLHVLEKQLLSFQGSLSSIVDFNNKLDRITQGIQITKENSIPPNQKLARLLDECGLSSDNFLGFLITYESRFSSLKGIDKELKDVKDCYDKTRNSKLALDTSNRTDARRLDNILKKIAAYAFVVEKYCLFAYNLYTFVGLCDRPNGYYFKKECEKGLYKLLCKEKGFQKDKSVFHNDNLALLLAENYAKNAHEIYVDTATIRDDIRNRARNIA